MNDYEDIKKEKEDPIQQHYDNYQDEAYYRFGNTNAYKESHERTSKYSKEELQKILEKGNIILKRIAELMEEDPASHEVQQLVDEWRSHICSSFYNCTVEILRGLGKGYVLDQRFTKNLDKIKPGLAHFLSKAIEIYCEQRR